MLFSSKKVSQRQVRVGEEVRAQLSKIIPQIIQWNDIFKEVNFTVTHVHMSPDLRNATVFISFFDVEEKKRNLALESFAKMRVEFQEQLKKDISKFIKG